MKVITIAMIFLSLFVGIPGFGKAVEIDGNWMTLYRFEFIDFPSYIGNIASWSQVGLWVCLLIPFIVAWVIAVTIYEKSNIETKVNTVSTV